MEILNTLYESLGTLAGLLEAKLVELAAVTTETVQQIINILAK